MKINGKLFDRAILQAQNDELKDYGVLIDMYREYREKRRKEHKRKLTERELQLEFLSLYSEKIRKECKGIIDNYIYMLNLMKQRDTRKYLLDRIFNEMQSCYEKMWEAKYCLNDKTKYDKYSLKRDRLHTIYTNLLCMNPNPKHFNLRVQSIIFIFSVIEEPPLFEGVLYLYSCNIPVFSCYDCFCCGTHCCFLGCCHG